jgi:hypothetical protein
MGDEKMNDDFTLLDLKNILEWFELIPNDSKSVDKFKRTLEKIRGLFNIHEDRSEPLLENLISSTLLDLELHTQEDLKSAKSLLLNRKTRLEEKNHQRETEMMSKNNVLEINIATLEKDLYSFLAEKQEVREITTHEISKIVEALAKIDKKLESS